MLSVDFINVGYGDAILIREDDFRMLVDCGDRSVGDGNRNSSRISAASFLTQEGIHTLDLLVLTHLHRDHSGGLSELLKGVTVKRFWCNYLPPEAYWGIPVSIPQDLSAASKCLLESLNIYLEALKTMRTKGTSITIVSPGLQELTSKLVVRTFIEGHTIFDRQEEIWKHVLAGRFDNSELEELDRFINNTSIRLRLSYGGRSFELPGDMYADCWETHNIEPCTVVKLPHHGHPDSMTKHLLDMLNPEYAVISVSNSRTDDCPSKTVLELLKSHGCKILITDAVPISDISPVPHQYVRVTVDEKRIYAS